MLLSNKYALEYRSVSIHVTHLKSHFYLLYVHDTVLSPDLGVQVGIVIVRYVKKLLFVKNPGTFVGYGPCLH